MSQLSSGEKRALLAELIKKKSAGPKTVPLHVLDRVRSGRLSFMLLPTIEK